MVTLCKSGKVYYKLENGELVGGSHICAKTQEQLEGFKEFNSIEEAKAYYGVEEVESEYKDGN